MNSSPARVEKIMSLTLSDFHRSVKALTPTLTLQNAQTDVQIQAGESSVRISYEALEGARLGGLLALPRARVTLHLDGLDPPGRRAFLTRFDRAFQRGGG